MTDKVLCPWCGSEMEFDFVLRKTAISRAYVCPECGASSPKVVRNCLEKTAEELDKETKAAALRRYEPPCKPLTLEEACNADHCHYESDTKGASTEVVLLGEDKVIEDDLYVEILKFGEDAEFCFFEGLGDYGKTWRCWPRKPTEEERQAAGWEDAK